MRLCMRRLKVIRENVVALEVYMDSIAHELERLSVVDIQVRVLARRYRYA